ncbi:ATP-dependent Clp protease ATP-binding subunit ClpX [Folsomia candida]|uniref:ATP-dependent Clp protease ATP-binding subunit ClpX n=1 Tax=Folsomia candida TaxID=158441 RepID=A0A226EKS4_FOLCA|nr:ATP-dependent Clp protease ATP-binding subunit ClpX [Folsomia candida]
MDAMYKSSTFSIIAPVILQGVPDIEHIRQVIKVKLLEKIDPKTGKWFYPELLQNISYWWGYAFWTKLDKITPTRFIQECVHFYKNDDKMQCDFQQLEDITRELCFKPYSKDKPLVEFILIPKFIPDLEKQWSQDSTDDKKYFVLILRIHHSVADGYAILRLFENLSISSSSDAFDYLKPHDYTQQRNANSLSFTIKIAKYIALGFKMIYQVSEYMCKSMLYCSEGSLWDWPAKRPTSPKLWNAVPVAELPMKRYQNYKTSWGRLFYLSEINDIKKIHGVSGTAVMYAAILGSIRQNMFAGSKTIPPYMSFASSALMTMFVPLGESDPIKRLHKMQQHLDIMKRSTLPVAATLLTNGVMGLVPRAFASLVDETAKLTESAILSNMAGPKKFYDLAGYPVRDTFWATGQIIDRNCVFMNIFSGGGKARLAVMGHAGLIESDQKAQNFIDSFFQELEIMKTSQQS